MNGVMMPGVSAGSNHVGASVTWMAQVAWPCAAGAGVGTPATRRPVMPAAISGNARRTRSERISDNLLAVAFWAARVPAIIAEALGLSIPRDRLSLLAVV